ncbi:MAG: bifunctional folylpolyglutamate synthase/dihydrofolate synthase [Clostridiales bacterium]|nr:bifunctional folylpolyglutamate synthase/dihydrofolate synthase [Clostridiales bacterium]
MASFDGLDRMKALLAALGNPEAAFKVLHIAGTNGKGSTAVMVASMLEEAGYRVGVYTSPHLESECERVQLWDGEHRMIDQSELDGLREKVKNTLHSEEPTVFEVYTAAAYLWFKEQAPDYVVLETGLGGRLDSTNTISKPLVTVITQVGLDHTAELGNTIFKIAREKAGIIKDGVPVVSQTPDLSVKNILRMTASEKGAEFIDASDADQILSRFRSKDGGSPVTMRGEHQRHNAATAVAALDASGIEISDEAMAIGLSKANLPGRFEILNEDSRREGEPWFIIDGAHNPDAIEALVSAYTAFARSKKIKRTLVIFGCMKDKNSVRMVQLLTGGLRGCSYAATAVSYARAESPDRIGELIAEAGRDCIVCDSIEEAYGLASDPAYECILVTGSIYLAGEMRRLFTYDYH